MCGMCRRPSQVKGRGWWPRQRSSWRSCEHMPVAGRHSRGTLSPGCCLQFLEVEEAFQGAAETTEQEVIDGLRKVGPPSFCPVKSMKAQRGSCVEGQGGDGSHHCSALSEPLHAGIRRDDRAGNHRWAAQGCPPFFWQTCSSMKAPAKLGKRGRSRPLHARIIQSLCNCWFKDTCKPLQRSLYVGTDAAR